MVVVNECVGCEIGLRNGIIGWGDCFRWEGSSRARLWVGLGCSVDGGVWL